MSRMAPVVCLLLGWVLGCSKPTVSPAATADALPPSPPSSETPAALEVAPAVAESDFPDLLARLTQAVRQYGVEQRRAPRSLDELVAAGYLAAVPAAPPGQKFVINKNLQVVVAGR